MSKPGWTSAMVVFHDHPPAVAKDLLAQKDVTIKQRQALLEHLEQAGVTSEVQLPPATPMPSLLVEGSARALAECLQAPSVKEVLDLSGDVPMGTL